MSEHASRAHRQVQLSKTESLPDLNARIHWVFVPISLFALLFYVVSTLDSILVSSAEAVGSLLVASAFVVAPKTDIVATVALSGGYVPAAIRAVESERAQVEAECEKFEEFAQEVQSLSTANRSVMGTTAQTVNTTSSNRVLETVREQYRETIMSTPDFDNEYGETFREHAAAEFGDDVASVLTDGQHLNEPVKGLVVQQARQSAKQRELLLKGLAIEERSLNEANAALEPVQCFVAEIQQTDLFKLSFPELIAIDDDLRRYRGDCHSLLRKRQQEIHTVNRRMQGETKTLTQEYLYATLEVSFPVLSTTLEYLDTLSDIRSTLVRAVSYSN